MHDPSSDARLTAVIDELERCLLRLDALGPSRAAILVDHAIETLRADLGAPATTQPKQDRPA